VRTLLFDVVGLTLTQALRCWFGDTSLCALLGAAAIANLRAVIAARLLEVGFEALQSAHSMCSLLHADLRPDNILISRSLADVRAAMARVNTAAEAGDLVSAVALLRAELGAGRLLLNDWGSSVAIGTSASNAVGWPPYMSAALLSGCDSYAAEHDYDALALTVLAVALGPPGSDPEGFPPWFSREDIAACFFGERQAAQQARDEWLSDTSNAARVGEVLKQTLLHVADRTKITKHYGKLLVTALRSKTNASSGAARAAAEAAAKE
jgi:serine/threonine protein kinase